MNTSIVAEGVAVVLVAVGFAVFAFAAAQVQTLPGVTIEGESRLVVKEFVGITTVLMAIVRFSEATKHLRRSSHDDHP